VPLLLACTLLALPAPAADEAPADSSRSIAAALQPFVDSHTLAGAVALVASKDKVLACETVGYSDVAARKPMPKDAFCWIASMSKPITGAAFMILVDRGKVKIDDPVQKHIPEFGDVWVEAYRDGDTTLLKRPKTRITVKHVLSMTSGLPFKSRMEEPSLDLLPLRDAVRSYAMTPLQSEPGTRVSYSNAGINTAGRIIEVVSGMAYEKFLQKELFDPLGMKDTTFWPTEAQLARLAKAYRPTRDKTDLEYVEKIGQLHYPLTDPSRKPMPAGGLFSTADDVGRFCRMVLGGGEFEGKRILSEKAVKEMTSKQTGNLPQSRGLGWSAPGKPGGSFGHGGAYSTNMTIDPEKGLALVLLLQHAGFAHRDDGGKIVSAFHKAADRFAR
jgi:CubicO group peptidase (beta-lactamase class C family)